MAVSVRAISGDALLQTESPAAAALARLRVAVFAEYPYLYAGDAEYEARHLRDFLSGKDALVVIAEDGEAIVGAATSSSMESQPAEFRAPFADHDNDTQGLFYFGESVLLREYRGQGVGHAFFDMREAHALSHGATGACFAAVVRPEDDRLRPADYHPLEPFWRRRGYEPVAGLITTISWTEHGETAESAKPMQIWLRRFGPRD